jgi:C1A family cysteine protease
MRIPMLVSAALLFGCSPHHSPSHVRTAQGDDGFEPLSSHSTIFRNAPKNGSLPQLGKADAVYQRQSTDLLQVQSPVKNQVHRGVCTIFTTTGLMEHLYLKAGFSNPSFSEQYLQWAVKAQLGVLQSSEGSNISDNVEAIAQFGIVDEATYPYNPNEWTTANDPACNSTGAEDQTLPMKCWTQGDPPPSVQQAQKYFLPHGRFINTTDIKAHMTANHTAVGVGLDFFYQAWNHRLSTLPVNSNDFAQGIVRYPNDSDVTESHKQRAGHGILIVGWDDDLQIQKVDAQDQPMYDADGNPVMESGFYIFKNSWGTDRFGVNNQYGSGYGLIAQRYVESFGSAYVTDVPQIQPPPPACQYNCADYGFAPNQCYSGWVCDAAGSCLSYAGSCN